MHFNWVRKEYETRSQRTLDFVLGVVIWLVVNALFAAGFLYFTNATLMTNDPTLSTLTAIGVTVCSIGPFIANIAGIIILAIYRRWIAFGMLATLGLLLVIVMCLGVILIGMCGTGLQNL